MRKYKAFKESLLSVLWGQSHYQLRATSSDAREERQIGSCDLQRVTSRVFSARMGSGTWPQKRQGSPRTWASDGRRGHGDSKASLDSQAGPSLAVVCRLRNVDFVVKAVRGPGRFPGKV